jgi:translocation and assembly module TamA
MCNINFELRFPIIKQVGGVLFNDCGLLSSDMYADFRPENILGATGCGIRFATPFGPLRFDIGWKWRRHMHCERSYAWFLTFGQAF